MQKVITWLQSRPLIKIHALEIQCGIPRGALNKALHGNARYLSNKHLPAITAALKPYGLK